MLNSFDDICYDIVIPGPVAHSDLPDSVKFFYGKLRALCRREGYCYPSNAWLAEDNKQSERTVRQWLELLETSGFITRRQSATPNGKVKRCIYMTARASAPIPDDLPPLTDDDVPMPIEPDAGRQKSATQAEEQFFLDTGWQKSATQGGKNLPPKYILINNTNNNPPNPPCPDKVTATPSTKKYGAFDNIEIEPTQYSELCAKYGAKYVDDIIEQASAYKASHPRKRFADFALLVDFCLRKRPRQEPTKRDDNYPQRDYSPEQLKSLFDDLPDGPISEKSKKCD